MKNIRHSLLFFIILPAIFSFLLADSQDSLADLYRGGKVRFIPEITLDDDSMPEDVFFQSPYSITGDNEGNIYICDYRANNIKKFSESGKFIKIIGREGQGPGEFSWPFFTTFARDRLIVWDMQNMRLCSLSPDGEYIKAVKIDFFSGNPRKLRSLPNGNIILEREKRIRGEPDKPQVCLIELFSSDLKHKKTIYSHEVWRNKFVRFEGGGGNVPQPFSPLVHWDVTPEGKIVIGFSEKYEISIYDSEKDKLSTFSHSYEPVKVTEEDKKIHFGGMTYSRDGVRIKKIPDYVEKNTKFPKFKPAFYNVIVDPEGNILVFPYRENRQEMSRYFDAFDSKGNFIANVQVVGDVPFPARSGGSFLGRYVWSTRTGEDELIKIIKYKISE
ncbi:MAG: 6-bladed beta-propeller [Candidatus Aminicenantes bacterium]